jgi:hypothetical protein
VNPVASPAVNPAVNPVAWGEAGDGGTTFDPVTVRVLGADGDRVVVVCLAG